MDCNEILFQFETERLRLIEIALWILGGWSIMNICLGLIFKSLTRGSRKFLLQMNVYWNLVNLAIAAISLVFQSVDVTSDLPVVIFSSFFFEKILLFNAGLDVGYVFLGLWLKEKSYRHQDSERLFGFGLSIMIQGLALFLFDLIFFLVLSNHTSKLKSLVTDCCNF